MWQGGANTAFVMELKRVGGHFQTTDEDTVALLRRLAASYDDTTIAVILARQGRRTGTGLSFTKSRVASLRVAKGIPAHKAPAPTPRDDNAVIVGLAQAEQLLKVSKVTIYRWLRDGFITGEQLTPGGPWHIRIDDSLRAKVVGEVPEGWVGLETAAKTLGIARQTVLDRIRRGELRAVHVNRGRRKGLAIEVGPPRSAPLPGTRA